MLIIFVSAYRVITCLKNLEMSEKFTAGRETFYGNRENCLLLMSRLTLLLSCIAHLKDTAAYEIIVNIFVEYVLTPIVYSV